jgi:hypothetical protein
VSGTGGNARVRFAIDRVTLHGFSSARGARFLSALHAELTVLGEGGGLTTAAQRPANRRLASLDGGALRPGSTPEQAAERVAGALREALGGMR